MKQYLNFDRTDMQEEAEELKKSIYEDEVAMGKKKQSYLESQIKEFATRVNSKDELVKAKRNTISKDRLTSVEVKFPSVVVSQRNKFNISLQDVKHEIALYDSKESQSKEEEEVKKKEDAKELKLQRPSSNYFDTSCLKNPTTVFQNKKITPNIIRSIAHGQFERDKCRNLSEMLELQTSADKKKIPELSDRFRVSLNERKDQLKTLNNPDHVPTQKLLECSKFVQMAYLDKIIEDCNEEYDKKVT